jgi:DNA (cytosine-5)-methyltransferase 1
MNRPDTRIAAIDLFCGAGGLSLGLKDAGVSVVAGIDLDPACRYPFESNIEAAFLEKDVRQVTADHLRALWSGAAIRLLAGCAPCQPFSPHRRGADTSADEDWALLEEFSRLATETEPTLLTMENVPRIGSSKVFKDFVQTLDELGYSICWRSVRCTDFGLAQTRRRLVLLASRLGRLDVPAGDFRNRPLRTVRDTISDLPTIAAGEADPTDPLHISRSLSEVNIRRMRASRPGGTWEDWPFELRSPCHQKPSGATFRNVYARMEWDKPAPTITTLAHNFGTGRFGHPEQDRPISLREAAMLQGFPRDYRFVSEEKPIYFGRLGRLIGNAVPPPLAKAIGRALVDHVRATTTLASTAHLG